MLGAASFNVTTALLVVGALFIVYLRLRNWFDTNVPLIYYGLMVVYTNALDGLLKPWVIYFGVALALLLRFEFMNVQCTRAVKSFELLVLAVIVWQCTAMIFQL
jgi:hypothetical protein